MRLIALLALAGCLRSQQPDWGTQIRNKPSVDPRAYTFTVRPTGNLVNGTATVTLERVPSGVNATNSGHYLWASGGTGAAGLCLISGGTAVEGGANQTLQLTCSGAHSGAYALTSASAGVTEAHMANPGKRVEVASQITINGPITFNSAGALSCSSPAAKILVSASMPTNLAAIWVYPTVPITKMEISQCIVTPVSGTPGSYGIHVELNDSNKPVYKLKLEDLRIGDELPTGPQFSLGSVYLDNSNDYLDGIFLSEFEGGLFTGTIKGDNLGDSLSFTDTRVHGVGTCIDISGATVGDNLGASQILFKGLNLYCNGGGINIRSGNRIKISYSNLESYGAGPCMINLAGESGNPIYDAEISGNFFSMISSSYTNTICLDYAVGTRIFNNTFGLGYAPQRGVACTANTQSLYAMWNNLNPTFLTKGYLYDDTCKAALAEQIPLHPEGTAIACASSLTPPSKYFKITGTCTIAGINVADELLYYAGEVCAVGVAGFNTNTSTNIAAVSTVPAGGSICWTYLPSTSKWHPNR